MRLRLLDAAGFTRNTYSQGSAAAAGPEGGRGDAPPPARVREGGRPFRLYRAGNLLRTTARTPPSGPAR